MSLPFHSNRSKKQKKSIATPQPEYELAVQFAKSLFNQPPLVNYESDLYNHFSKILSTESNKLVITKENFRELVTFQRKYPRCEIKLVPRVDPTLQSSASKLSSIEDVEVEQENAEEETQQTEPTSTAISKSQPKNKSSTSRTPKKSSKGIAPSVVSEQPSSPVASPQGKLKRASRSLGALPKLCNPVQIATVHRDHLPLLQFNFLPLLNPEITGEQFFHRIVQHCSSEKGKNLVLVSRPFKSTTLKEDGAPLVVRQVSVCFIPHLLCTTFIWFHEHSGIPFPLHSWEF